MLLRCSIVAVFLAFCLNTVVFAQTAAEQKDADATINTETKKETDNATTKDGKKKKISINEIVVKGEANKMVFPIVTKNKIMAGDPQSIMDLLQSQAILDYTGQSDLVIKDDNFNMRGMSSSRFTTAYDGMVIRKTGGRQASDIVDYGFIPPWLVEKTEIIPGPHSALYPGKSIGGVINFVAKKPEMRDTLIPEAGISASYKSYNTQNYNVNASGNISHFTYDCGYQYYKTDGYLRHTETDVRNLFGRAGFVLNNGGFATISIVDSKANRDLPVANSKGVDAVDGNPLSTATYDPDYPEVTIDALGDKNAFYSWSNPSWDRTSRAYRINLNLPTFLGTISGGGYAHEEVKTKDYIKYQSGANHHLVSDAFYWSRGGRIQDEVVFTQNHKTTVAYDFEQLLDSGNSYTDGNLSSESDKKKRVQVNGGAIQHEWNIFSPLTLTVGLRYEDVRVNVSNSSSYPIAGEGEWIKRNWDGWLPKSSLIYDMDDIADFLRDTSVIAAVSRIWHAPDYHGLYNPQGAPAGAWLKSEDGMAYDLIFSRRLFNDFYMKAGYSFNNIRNYMAYNSTHAEYTPSTSHQMDDEANLRYKDYMINLQRMHRHGIEADLNGNVIERLNLYISYAYQKFISQGDEPAGKEEASGKPKHKLNAGIRLTLIKNLVFITDYSYESKQVTVTYDDDTEEYIKNSMSCYHVVDMGLSFKFIDNVFGMKDATFKVFVDNVFNEKYENARGFPETDRTYGCALSANI